MEEGTFVKLYLSMQSRWGEADVVQKVSRACLLLPYLKTTSTEDDAVSRLITDSQTSSQTKTVQLVLAYLKESVELRCLDSCVFSWLSSHLKYLFEGSSVKLLLNSQTIVGIQGSSCLNIGSGSWCGLNLFSCSKCILLPFDDAQLDNANSSKPSPLKVLWYAITITSLWQRNIFIYFIFMKMNKKL